MKIYSKIISIMLVQIMLCVQSIYGLTFHTNIGSVELQESFDKKVVSRINSEDIEFEDDESEDEIELIEGDSDDESEDEIELIEEDGDDEDSEQSISYKFLLNIMIGLGNVGKAVEKFKNPLLFSIFYFMSVFSFPVSSYTFSTERAKRAFNDRFILRKEITQTLDSEDPTLNCDEHKSLSLPKIFWPECHQNSTQDIYGQDIECREHYYDDCIEITPINSRDPIKRLCPRGKLPIEDSCPDILIGQEIIRPADKRVLIYPKNLVELPNVKLDQLQSLDLGAIGFQNNTDGLNAFKKGNFKNATDFFIKTINQVKHSTYIPYWNDAMSNFNLKEYRKVLDNFAVVQRIISSNNQTFSEILNVMDGYIDIIDFSFLKIPNCSKFGPLPKMFCPECKEISEHILVPEKEICELYIKACHRIFDWQALKYKTVCEEHSCFSEFHICCSNIAALRSFCINSYIVTKCKIIPAKTVLMNVVISPANQTEIVCPNDLTNSTIIPTDQLFPLYPDQVKFDIFENNALGLNLFDQKFYDQALLHFNNALIFNNTMFELNYNKAMTLFNLGMYKSAIDTFGYVLNNTNDSSFLNVTECYIEQIGQFVVSDIIPTPFNVTRNSTILNSTDIIVPFNVTRNSTILNSTDIIVPFNVTRNSTGIPIEFLSSENPMLDYLLYAIIGGLAVSSVCLFIGCTGCNICLKVKKKHLEKERLDFFNKIELEEIIIIGNHNREDDNIRKFMQSFDDKLSEIWNADYVRKNVQNNENLEIFANDINNIIRELDNSGLSGFKKDIVSLIFYNVMAKILNVINFNFPEKIVGALSDSTLEVYEKGLNDGWAFVFGELFKKVNKSRGLLDNNISRAFVENGERKWKKGKDEDVIKNLNNAQNYNDKSFEIEFDKIIKTIKNPINKIRFLSIALAVFDNKPKKQKNIKKNIKKMIDKIFNKNFSKKILDIINDSNRNQKTMKLFEIIFNIIIKLRLLSEENKKYIAEIISSNIMEIYLDKKNKVNKEQFNNKIIELFNKKEISEDYKKTWITDVVGIINRSS